ncbi:hypothetical protein MUK42_02986 [Musa troglodytarum]|uniref:Uncharacterized protein n=1 Tax=Musa troglodytarum TaxID=320322 RepID=A0A9E7G7Y7_9LILI|nr:hypothetical protein MUK42_02986 [Musa troglodytarum]
MRGTSRGYKYPDLRVRQLTEFNLSMKSMPNSSNEGSAEFDSPFPAVQKTTPLSSCPSFVLALAPRFLCPTVYAGHHRHVQAVVPVLVYGCKYSDA